MVVTPYLSPQKNKGNGGMNSVFFFCFSNLNDKKNTQPHIIYEVVIYIF